MDRKAYAAQECTKFEHLLNNSGHGQVFQLATNCSGSHVFHPFTEDSHADLSGLHLLFKPSTKNLKNQGFSMNRCDFQGLFVLWDETTTSVIIPHRTDIKVSSGTVARLVTLHPDFCTTKDNLGMYFKALFLKIRDAPEHEIIHSFNSASLILQRPPRGREITQHIDNHGQEAVAQEEIEEIFADETAYFRTPEACLADSYTVLNQDMKNVFRLQLKSTKLNKKKKFVFSSTLGYDEMLVVGRAFGEKWCIVIPGKGLPSQIEMNVSSKKYSPYIVKDDSLVAVLQGIHTAVLNDETSYTWPSGHESDISNIILCNAAEACTPLGEGRKIEAANRQKRQAAFAGHITMKDPRIQHTHVDIILDSITTQDKTGHCSNGSNKTFAVTILKSAGRIKGKQKVQPYHYGDFELLFVFAPNDVFFCIPSAVLLEKKILSSPDQAGQTSFAVCLPGSTSKYAWTAEYIYSFKDKNAPTKVKQLLENIKLSRASQISASSTK